jgi:hypothetical protein
MSFSKTYPHELKFLLPRKILTPMQAFLFIIEEAALVFLIVLQIYQFIGIDFVGTNVVINPQPILFQNIVWFVGTILFLTLGYVVIAMRDTTVRDIHTNFSKLVFNTTKHKVKDASKETVIFFIAEATYAIVFAIAIFVYLDPDINLLPATTPPMFNYIGFAIIAGFGLFLFSKSKEFRTAVYGLTPVQKRIHHGNIETRRFTNKKTGSIRITPKKHYSGLHKK